MIRVFVIDDSSAVRKALVRVLSEDARMEVVGSAESAEDALERIEHASPDVITLDVNMPGMGGFAFLHRLMRLRATPVIIVSSEVRKDSTVAREALRLGAVAVLPKPHAEYPIAVLLEDLKRAIVDAGRSRPNARRASARPSPVLATSTKVIAVASSTGGTVAFDTFASGLPVGHPPVVLAQHLPADFVPRFVERLSDSLAAQVRVATGNERLLPNTVWVAPGTHHLQVRREGGVLFTELLDGPPVNFHRPSCDVLLESVARAAGRDAIGVILTGMGADGARGLLALKNVGACTFAQDEESCVVYGMPRAAVELGAAREIVPLDRLATRVSAMLYAAPTR